jgi:hypothetical protein
MKRRFILFAIAALVATALPLAAASADETHPSLDPASVTENVALGGSFDVTKTVHVPEIPPNADVYFLVDTTGSMVSVINQIKTDIGLIIPAVQAADPSTQFGLSEYKDFPFDAFAFNPIVPNGPDDGVGGGFDVSDAVAGLAAGGGFDGSEGQFYAMDQLAGAGNPGGFTPSTASILVWIGDAPAHDPVCSAISGLGYGITEASVTAKLVAPAWGGNGINVVAISTTTGFPAGLDDDPTLIAGDYGAACGAPGGVAGQATRITGATGGTHLTNVPPGQIAAAILTAIGSVTVNVSMTTDCAAPIGVSFAPASQNVTSGGHAVFTETIDVAGADPDTYQCDDWALIGDNPMTDAAGAIIKEHKTITVVAATCDPTENPHGNNKPVAPGNGGQGQNQDGYYIIGSTSDEAVWVLDDGSGTMFGPFADEDEIKYVEDDSKTPASKAMAGNKSNSGSGGGSATDTDWHIIGNGDALVVYQDGFGNVTTAACLVPPPPK